MGVFDVYWYEKNMQGDVVAVYNGTGTKLVSYVYDAYGNFTRTLSSGVSASSVAAKNPFTYRGYYYDYDLELYYVSTRYYDSDIGRWLSLDKYVSTGQGLSGYNMFVYCNNNPIMYVDYSGQNPIGAIAAAALPYVAAGMLIISIGLLIYDATHEQVLAQAFESVVDSIGTAVDSVVKSFSNVKESATSIENEKDEAISSPHPDNSVTYYHVTTPESAAAILSSGVLVGSQWEGGFVYVGKTKPNKYAINNSGAHSGVTISFKTNAAFVADTGITDPRVQMYGPLVSVSPGPIIVWDVQIVE